MRVLQLVHCVKAVQRRIDFIFGAQLLEGLFRRRIFGKAKRFEPFFFAAVVGIIEFSAFGNLNRKIVHIGIPVFFQQADRPICGSVDLLCGQSAGVEGHRKDLLVARQHSAVAVVNLPARR